MDQARRPLHRFGVMGREDERRAVFFIQIVHQLNNCCARLRI
jgi:hypothetical protein